jgi:hypothetical protein
MEDLRIAFVIMQIGDRELDKMYSDILIPAIEAANLIPKRIDLNNKGKLLKNEIIEYIEKAEIIIADLTNERPNCYLEVGYAMGLDKYKNLIFTVREDHYSESPNYKKGGPKIHFDVTGYDILFWNNNNMDDFKSKLTDKINRRLSIISPISKRTEKPLWDESWLENQRNYVSEKFKEIGISRQMEVLVSPIRFNLNIPQMKLLEIADDSQINTFGWPIGVIFKNVPKLKPVSKTDGIISEVNESSQGLLYDFTYFKKNGQIYISKSLFEEDNYKDSIIPEVRIKRATELLMYVSRFYTRCNLPENEKIKISIEYSGLFNNNINFANRGIPSRITRISNENDSISEIITSISDIEGKLPELVTELLESLFILFDFYKPEFGYVKSIVDKFVIETKNIRH